MHYRFMRKSSTSIVFVVSHDILSSDQDAIDLSSLVAFFLVVHQKAMALRVPRSLYRKGHRSF